MEKGPPTMRSPIDCAPCPLVTKGLLKTEHTLFCVAVMQKGRPEGRPETYNRYRNSASKQSRIPPANRRC
jgi:hypothetical protein